MKHDCRKTEGLLAEYLTGKLTQGDRQRIDLILEDCGDCARTLKEMQQSSKVNDDGHMPETEHLKDAKNPVTKTSANIGQVLTVGGLILFYGGLSYWGLKEMISDPEVPVVVKIGIPILVIGIGILLASVMIDRIKASKNDPYKDVEI